MAGKRNPSPIKPTGISKKKKKKKMLAKLLKQEKKQKRNPDNFLMQPSFESLFKVGEIQSVHVVYIDGACWNNGTENAKAGYGVYWGADHPLNVAAPLPGLGQTSSRAEFKAVSAICALEQAISNEFPAITLRTDSLVVADTMTKLIPLWRQNGWTNKRGEPILDIDLIQRLEELLTLGVINVTVEHVKGHSGDHGNECADRLATQGAMM